jgi:excisionase family DNA binding protein
VSVDHDPLELLTIAEVAVLLKRGKRTIQRDVAEKKIYSVKHGRQRRIPRSEVERINHQPDVSP